MCVYKKVRLYIENKDLKQKAVAKQADISVSTFNAMMNGKRTMYAEDLKAICYALNISPEEFIEVHNSSKK